MKVISWPTNVVNWKVRVKYIWYGFTTTYKTCGKWAYSQHISSNWYREILVVEDIDEYINNVKYKNNSTKMYLDKINILLDTYAPLKRINKYELKLKSKPWITLNLQKSISIKNKLLTNFINKKDPIL